MKKLFAMLAVVLALALPQAGSAMDVEGFYAGGIGGLNWLTSTKSHKHEQFKAGWLAGADFGYRFCGGYRAEVEAVYRSNKHKHAHRPVQTWSFMANGYYELADCWCITPYVGAGIGYDRTKHKRCHNTIVVIPGADIVESPSHNDHKNGFAWQLMAGGAFDVDENIEMALEYCFHQGPLSKFFNNAVEVKLNFFF